MTDRDQRIRDLAEKLFVKVYRHEWEGDYVEAVVKDCFSTADAFVELDEKWCEERGEGKQNHVPNLR